MMTTIKVDSGIGALAIILAFVLMPIIYPVQADADDSLLRRGDVICGVPRGEPITCSRIQVITSADSDSISLTDRQLIILGEEPYHISTEATARIDRGRYCASSEGFRILVDAASELGRSALEKVYTHQHRSLVLRKACAAFVQCAGETWTAYSEDGIFRAANSTRTTIYRQGDPEIETLSLRESNSSPGMDETIPDSCLPAF